MAVVVRANRVRLMENGPQSGRKGKESNRHRTEKPKNISNQIATPVAVASKGAFSEVSSFIAVIDNTTGAVSGRWPRRNPLFETWQTLIGRRRRIRPSNRLRRSDAPNAIDYSWAVSTSLFQTTLPFDA